MRLLSRVNLLTLAGGWGVLVRLLGRVYLLTLAGRCGVLARLLGRLGSGSSGSFLSPPATTWLFAYTTIKYVHITAAA